MCVLTLSIDVGKAFTDFRVRGETKVRPQSQQRFDNDTGPLNCPALVLSSLHGFQIVASVLPLQFLRAAIHNPFVEVSKVLATQVSATCHRLLLEDASVDHQDENGESTSIARPH